MFVMANSNSKTPLVVTKRADARISCVDSDSTGSGSGCWPRYLIMSATDADKRFCSLSPFAIFKGVKGIAGDGVVMKRLFNGDVVLTCSTKSQSDNLLKCVSFGNIAPVVVTPHKFLNSSKGVIRNWELARTNPEEIKQEIPIITDVHRIVVKKNNTTVDTNTLIVTFNVPKVPENIRSGYLIIPVSPYIPKPLRCYKCQTFGHTTNKCKRDLVCARCSEKGHDDKSCQQEFKCANCDGNHASYSNKCSYFKREFEIQSIRIKNSVSFFEARKVYEQTHGKKVMDYAAAAANAPVQVASICVQTDVTWLGPNPITKKQATVPSKPVNAASRSVGTSACADDIAAITAAIPSSSKQSLPAKKHANQKRDQNNGTSAQAKTRSKSPARGSGVQKVKPTDNVKNKEKAPARESGQKVNPTVKDKEKTLAPESVKPVKQTVKDKEKSKGSSSSPVPISPIQFREALARREGLKRTYKASDFLVESELSPSRTVSKKTKSKTVDKDVTYSNVHKQRPVAEDYFMPNQYDVLQEDLDARVISASDLKKKTTETLKKGLIKLNPKS